VSSYQEVASTNLFSKATNKTPLFLGQPDDARASLASAISQYNDLLASNLASFQAANGGITARIVDTSVPFNTAINNPTAYGAPNATCYNSNGVSCLWFNDYHPAIAIQKLVAAAVANIWETTGQDFFKSGQAFLCMN
jgi:phospholipase/lecithinase/hemolysin